MVPFLGRSRLYLCNPIPKPGYLALGSHYGRFRTLDHKGGLVVFSVPNYSTTLPFSYPCKLNR